VGTNRRARLAHLIVVNGARLRAVRGEFVAYHNAERRGVRGPAAGGRPERDHWRPRNDETLIVAGLHAAVLLFHSRAVDHVRAQRDRDGGDGKAGTGSRAPGV
jgi:hypothetical protein